MARNFVAASSQYLQRDSGIFSIPMTISCWFNVNDITNVRTLVHLCTIGTDTNYVALFARGDDVGDPVQLQINDGAGNSINTTSGYTAGSWNHACGVIASATDRRVYINGGNKTTTTVSRSPTGINRIAVGRYAGLTAGSYHNGLIAEIGIWNVALDDDEVAALGKGISPLLIRPSSLVAYYPLFGNDATEIDRWKNGYHLTVTGATKEAHPSIYMPNNLLFSHDYSAAVPPVTADSNMFLVF